MERHVAISTDPIDTAALAARAVSPETGAIVHFLGTVRGTESGDPINALEYECFRDMAEHQFNKILDQVEQRWPVFSVRIVHRIGTVPAGEASLWIEVTSAHRGEVFAAAQWMIDEMKRVVPIWKRVLRDAP